MQNKLQSTVYIRDYVDDFLQQHHFYEEFDPHKKYDNTDYTHDYGYGILTYTYILVISMLDNKKYVVAHEVLSQNDKERWITSNSCRCKYHTTSWYNPSKYFICKHCVGCIDSISPSQKVINETRRYISFINDKTI